MDNWQVGRKKVGGGGGVKVKGNWSMPPSKPMKVTPAPKAAPRRAYSPPAPTRSYGGGGGGGGGGGSSYSAPSGPTKAQRAATKKKDAEAAARKKLLAAQAKIPKTQEEWDLADADYVRMQADLQKAQETGLSGLRADKDAYHQNDYGEGLRRLGWDWDDDGDGMASHDEIQEGVWNPDDLQTAYGQDYQTQLADFSGRGMMDSSFYGDANTELTRGFDTQKTDMEMARQAFLAQIANQETGIGDEYASGLANAKSASADRYAAARKAVGL